MKYLCDNCSPKICCVNRFENKKTECDDYVPMNNEQFIRFCTTEQLAEWLQEHMDCSNCDCNKDLCYQGYDCCKLAFIEWLKQPHKE